MDIYRISITCSRNKRFRLDAFPVLLILLFRNFKVDGRRPAWERKNPRKRLHLFNGVNRSLEWAFSMYKSLSFMSLSGRRQTRGLKDRFALMVNSLSRCARLVSMSCSMSNDTNYTYLISIIEYLGGEAFKI